MLSSRGLAGARSRRSLPDRRPSRSVLGTLGAASRANVQTSAPGGRPALSDPVLRWFNFAAAAPTAGAVLAGALSLLAPPAGGEGREACSQYAHEARFGHRGRGHSSETQVEIIGFRKRVTPSRRGAGNRTLEEGAADLPEVRRARRNNPLPNT